MFKRPFTIVSLCLNWVGASRHFQEGEGPPPGTVKVRESSFTALLVTTLSFLRQLRPVDSVYPLSCIRTKLRVSSKQSPHKHGQQSKHSVHFCHHSDGNHWCYGGSEVVAGIPTLASPPICIYNNHNQKYLHMITQ